MSTKKVPPFYGSLKPPPAIPLVIMQTDLAPLTSSSLVPLSMLDLLPPPCAYAPLRHPSSKTTALKAHADRRPRSHAGTPLRASRGRTSSRITRAKRVTIDVTAGTSSEPGTDEDGDAVDEVDEDESLEEDQLEDDDIIMAPFMEDNGKIPKPAGEAGRPKRGGYALDEVLIAFGWVESELSAMKSFLHVLINKRLDEGKSYTQQSQDDLEAVVDEARKKFTKLELYDQEWPARDIIRARLKYTAGQAKKGVVGKRAGKNRAKTT
ncbi:hypothetical protein PHLGIDRAFT_123543 [Phlebiopsis gigantea 11061_1 CR5-6]|uniref:Uncharacterized protein n=1 Tax=Phlebiopsis gigantea (strain 11061_1 CR5-6) TaxID=745531 RepID=A0A0C3RP87_PHLG1|nr:hypothetical protein PHLGIDRAFT_123543 [Phlebiopsis gigantea 11061_1 CR5-6]